MMTFPGCLAPAKLGADGHSMNSGFLLHRLENVQLLSAPRLASEQTGRPCRRPAAEALPVAQRLSIIAWTRHSKLPCLPRCPV